MFNLENGKFMVDSPTAWTDLAVSLVLIAVIFVLVFKLLKRKAVVITLVSSVCLVFISWFLMLKLLWSISLVCTIAVLVVALIVNQGEIRDHFANSLGGVSKTKNNAEKIFDRHAMLQKVAIAVESLSRNKIGAIITFEKNTKLDDFVKSGTILNSPISPELLQTIFYPGTRLHDGAVVIRRDLIMAASVYYTPTTKPLTGKFGSRHRAAIGISEVTDSVTVVVSEETGRISLAVAGELIHVPADSFLRTLEDYILAEDTSTNNDGK